MYILAYIIFTRQEKRESREGSCRAISFEEDKHCEDEVWTGLVLDYFIVLQFF